MSETDLYTPINLGQKRKLYNECVRYGIETNTPIISEHIQGEDVEKLMKIDIACAKHDLNFILNALTDEDMLYVSRTITQSTWLITDNKYANIINPDNLQSQLLPKMTAKAGNKFMKHIRLHLKNESRVESFYTNEKNIKTALKWLLNCSLPFIEQEVTKHAKEIDIHLFKRLSEKSTSVWKILIRHKVLNNRNIRKAFETTRFILYKDTNEFMDIVEEVLFKIQSYDIPYLGIKGTEKIMKLNGQRVIDNLEKYLYILYIPTFAKCLKAEEVKDTLYKIVEVCTRTDNRNKYQPFCMRYDMFNFNSMKHFVQQMPIEHRYPFVKKVFIDKIHVNKTHEGVSAEELNKMANLFSLCKPLMEHDFIWYEFAPFNEAFAYFKEAIQKETRQCERNSMLKTLLDSAGSNMTYRKEVLQYFFNKHLNDKLINTEVFVNDFLLSKIPIHKYDESTWTIFEEVLRSMDIFKLSVYVPDNIIEAVIVYNIVNDKKVPEVIESKFNFNALKQYGAQMNECEKEKLFNYIYNYVLSKYDTCTVEDKVRLLYAVLMILKDWKKNLADFPKILDKIKECIEIKHKNNSWNLSDLYNVNKYWKKLMFEESIFLNPSEEVCINALKHDAGLLKRNKSEIHKLTHNDKVSLSRLLSKIRIFWCQTLAKEWADEYINRIKLNDGSKALVRGLCAILPRDQILNIIEQYTPETSEINWDTDPYIIALQQNIAKNMHTARPQPPPDMILRYAKGDYLQYALPSVLAIFHNLSQTKTLQCLPSVFNAPVSLQKHGLRIAVAKIPQQNIIDIFNSTWSKSKNVTIRAVIFKLTFTLLSKEKETGNIKALLEFLLTAIDSLSFEEDSGVYEYLGSVEQVPLSVRALYIEKSYCFIKKMLPSTSNDDRIMLQGTMKNILEAANKVMDKMCPKFVTELLLEYVEELNDKPVEQILHKNVKLNLLSTFLLTSSTEEVQNQRFDTVCKPFIGCFQKSCDKTLIPRLQFFLRKNLVEAIQNGMVIPEQLFSQLHHESSTVLSLVENYVLLTELQLFAALFKTLKNTEKGDLKDMLNNAAYEFGKVCVTHLQEDIANNFPLIYILFSQAIFNVYTSFDSVEDPEKSIRNSFCRSLLYNKDFKPAYLAALKVYFQSVPSNNKKVHQKSQNKALIDDILKTNSVEVRMHYYSNIEIA